MLRCNHCFWVTTDDHAAVCKHCGHFLADSKPLHRTRSLYSPSVTSHLVKRDKHVGKLSTNEVAIYAMDMDEPLITTLTEEVVLGRTSRISSVTVQPTIDLTPYQGVERGVSRAHAALRRYKSELAVIDLASTNGTWVNNNRIEPNVPMAIRNGDRIVLAKLSIYVYFE